MNNQDIPAFPVCMNGNQTVNQGMDLRDFFAAYIMSGSLASDTQEWNGGSDFDKAAAVAYLRADAMIRTRAKTSDQPPTAP